VTVINNNKLGWSYCYTPMTCLDTSTKRIVICNDGSDLRSTTLTGRSLMIPMQSRLMKRNDKNLSIGAYQYHHGLCSNGSLRKTNVSCVA